MFHVGQMTYTFYVQYIMEDPFSLSTSTYFLLVNMSVTIMCMHIYVLHGMDLSTPWGLQ